MALARCLFRALVVPPALLILDEVDRSLQEALCETVLERILGEFSACVLVVLHTAALLERADWWSGGHIIFRRGEAVLRPTK